jgi:hypothetical protein
MRWYCWIIFFAIVIISTWAFPADNVDESNALVIDNENEQDEDFIIESRILDEEDEDEDDQDDEITFEDGTLDITDRHLRKKKPQKQKKDNDKDNSSEDNGHDNKGEKKSKKKKCVCFRKKHNKNSKQKPQGPGNDRIKNI